MVITRAVALVLAANILSQPSYHWHDSTRLVGSIRARGAHTPVYGGLFFLFFLKRKLNGLVIEKSHPSRPPNPLCGTARLLMVGRPQRALAKHDIAPDNSNTSVRLSPCNRTAPAPTVGCQVSRGEVRLGAHVLVCWCWTADMAAVVERRACGGRGRDAGRL